MIAISFPQIVIKMRTITGVIFLSVALVIVLFHCTEAQRELCQAFVQECERDEFIVGSKRMILFSREKNWADAKAHCESRGMRLLTTTTKKEVDDLKTYLNSRIWDGRPDVYFWNLWLAANSLDPKGVWTWQTTKQDLNSTYTSWASGEPNGGESEACMELNLIYFDESRWNDVKCSDRKRYICETFDGGLNK